VRHVVIHYNEIGLKGRNQPLFLRRLEANLLRATAGTGIRRVDDRSDAWYCPCRTMPSGPPSASDSDASSASRIFSLADRSELDMSALKAAMDRALEGREFPSSECPRGAPTSSFP